MQTREDAQNSQIKKLMRELDLVKEEYAVMEMIARHANDGLLIQDINATIEWSNPAYTRITGYSAEEIKGHKPQEFLLPPENQIPAQEIAAFKYDIASGILDSFEVVRNVRKNGEHFWNQLSFAVVDYEGARDPKIIVISRDVTEQIEREENLKLAKRETQFRAEHDILTGLPNRMKLGSFLCDALENVNDEDGEVGILHVDLDHFKSVNDQLGHAAGDAVLIHAANVMTAITRPADLVCRFGGDEFIIVCKGILDFAYLESIAEQINSELKKPIVWEEQRILIGSSIGIALSTAQNRDQDELIKHADVALYEVKNNGRNGSLSYTHELGEIVSQRTELSTSLSRAIAEKQLGVLLQPQFDMTAKTVIGFETLIRWHHPTKGLLCPGDFFEIAERNGRMEDIDTIAQQCALDALKTLHDAGFPSMRISINVSAQTLNSPSYVDRLKWETDARNLDPKHIAIEVLETIFVQSSDDTVSKAIRALSEAGFAVELDDFGTGYSGLANLTRLNIHGVKIDRSLVQGAHEHHTSQVILKAVINLCRDLSLNVIAEGVERPEQADFMHQIGGALIQGYGVARPMPLKNAIKWLKTTDLDKILTSTGEFSAPVQTRYTA